MNIAFDLDGTITRNPAFFSVISKALVDAGHKVFIITWREDREFTLEDLAEHGITYTQLVLPSDEQIRGIAYQQWKTAAAQFKAEACRSLKIDVFFDDMPEVVNVLAPQTTAFMAVDPRLGLVKYEVDR
jgi:uncharacterized HAD superfamily protein